MREHQLFTHYGHDLQPPPISERKLQIIRFWVYEVDPDTEARCVIEIMELDWEDDLTDWQKRVIRHHVRKLCRIYDHHQIDVSHLFDDGTVEMFV